MRWFQYISERNADVIRVYTTLEPDFYEALYEYNEGAEKPLYFGSLEGEGEDTFMKKIDTFFWLSFEKYTYVR